MKKMLTLFLSLLVLATLIQEISVNQASAISPLTNVSANAASGFANKSTQYVVKFTTATTATLHDIAIEFPPDTDIPQITVAAAIAVGPTGTTSINLGQGTSSVTDSGGSLPVLTYALSNDVTVQSGSTVFLYIIKIKNTDLTGPQHLTVKTESAGPTTVDGPTDINFGIAATILDGTNVVLHNTRIPVANTVTTLDPNQIVDGGFYSSIAIGTDSLPVISYYDNMNGDLKVLHCGNIACSRSNTATTVDSAGTVGTDTSITIGTDGLPVVSYFDDTNFDLKVLHCGNIMCSSGNTATTVDSAGAVGYYTSITIGTDGLPVISYYDFTNGDMKVLHCGNTACSSGNTATTVDSTGDVGLTTSITIGIDGSPVVSYYDGTNHDLKVLHCGNTACSSGNTATTVDSTGDVGLLTSIAIGTDGLPVVSYFDNTNLDLKVLHCGNTTCNNGNTATTVDSAGTVGTDASIAIGTDGLPVISYRDNTNGDLKVLHCGNTTCNNGNTATTVESTGNVGLTTSIAIGTDGLPIIIYYDDTNGDLKVLHTGSILGISNWTRK